MMELVCAFTSTLLIGETVPTERRRTAMSFCSTLAVVIDTGGRAGPEAALAGADAAEAGAAPAGAAAVGALAPFAAGVGSADLVHAPSAQTKASPRVEIRINIKGERSVRVFMDGCSYRERRLTGNVSLPSWRPVAMRRDLSGLVRPHREHLHLPPKFRHFSR